MNVLLIEDNEADRRAVKEAFSLNDKSVNLYMVEDGEKALQFVGRHGSYAVFPRPDLILLDLNLPGTRGHDVLRKIKSAPETKRIPVIVLSSSTFQVDICECYDLGANCYITKPMRFTELLRLVKAICDFWLKEVRYCQP